MLCVFSIFDYFCWYHLILDSIVYIETPHLLLRDWEEEDILPFVRMNSDKEVMEFFLTTLTEEETMAFYCRIRKEFEEYGYGLYAVECKETQNFLGYVGFHNIAFESDFTPGVEIGWRLCRDAWGKGYATEAASACLDYASDNLPFKTVYSFTAIPNKRSERVMQKMGMHFEKEFDHPLVEQGHWLCRHILYKIEI